MTTSSDLIRKNFMLSEFPTADLVEELCRRSEVENIFVPPEGKVEICVDLQRKGEEWNNDKHLLYDKIHEGPARVLRIID